MSRFIPLFQNTVFPAQSPTQKVRLAHCVGIWEIRLFPVLTIPPVIHHVYHNSELLRRLSAFHVVASCLIYGKPAIFINRQVDMHCCWIKSLIFTFNLHTKLLSIGLVIMEVQYLYSGLLTRHWSWPIENDFKVRDLISKVSNDITWNRMQLN